MIEKKKIVASAQYCTLTNLQSRLQNKIKYNQMNKSTETELILFQHIKKKMKNQIENKTKWRREGQGVKENKRKNIHVLNKLDSI